MPRRPLKADSEVGSGVGVVEGAVCVAWTCLARALDRPGLVGVSGRPEVAVACAYDMGRVTEGREAAGMGLLGRMRVVAVAAVTGSVCVTESVLVAEEVCEAVSMVATDVCEAVSMVATSVCVAESMVVETVWVAVEEVDVGAVRISISVRSCRLEDLASSSDCVSREARDVAVKEEVRAEWSFVLYDAISALRALICSR